MKTNSSPSQPTARDREISDWLAGIVGPDYRLAPASSDASFRRYLRVTTPNSTLILMDAPPEHEDTRPFVHVQSLLQAAGINVPEVIEADLERGLLLLSDLGNRSYLQVLDESTCSPLYADALAALSRIQTRVSAATVPAFDGEKLRQELDLFPDWFLGRHLGMELPDEFRSTMNTCFEYLIEACLEQPQVFVHRDYHSRNLMLTEHFNPGVLDFQDAVAGPVTYDLVSLFRDVYIAWPEKRVEQWVRGYAEHIKPQLDALSSVEIADFFRWFDLTGIQRHIKVAGIFCRLWYRDRKPGYLKDIPLTLHYLTQIGARYPESRALVAELGELQIESRLERANANALLEPAGSGPL